MRLESFERDVVTPLRARAERLARARAAASRRAAVSRVAHPSSTRGSSRSSGGMTKILKRLEDAKLIERVPDPNDGRGLLVGLTREGLALQNRVFTVVPCRFSRSLRAALGREGARGRPRAPHPPGRDRARSVRLNPHRRPPMRTELCDRFGIDVPIFAFSHCRDVVAAVSKAGGMGVLGRAGVLARAARDRAQVDRRARGREAVRRRSRDAGEVHREGGRARQAGCGRQGRRVRLREADQARGHAVDREDAGGVPGAAAAGGRSSGAGRGCSAGRTAAGAASSRWRCAIRRSCS